MRALALHILLAAVDLAGAALLLAESLACAWRREPPPWADTVRRDVESCAWERMQRDLRCNVSPGARA